MSLLNWIKDVLGFETVEAKPEVQVVPGGPREALAETVEWQGLPMTEEEKSLVAVAASVIIGSEKPDMQLHIQRIRRVE